MTATSTRGRAAATGGESYAVAPAGAAGQSRPERRGFQLPGATAGNDAIATIALATLTLAGVFSLTRLFIGRGFVAPVLAVAIGAHLMAWLCRRQGWPPVVAVLVSLATLVLLVSWTVLPASTTYGLPLLGTLRAAGHAIHQATLDFHRVTAPAPATEGFVLLTVCSVGILAVLADWAAFRMRATLEATVPSFALFIFCAAIGSRGSRTAAVVVEVAALIAFVVIHQATMDQETSAWFANRTQGALRSAISAGAIIGLAALVVALNLGFRLPGATHKGVISWRASDGAGTGTRSTQSPLVDLRGRLMHPNPNPVFTVTSNQPEYWRQTALDSFDGNDWNALSTYHSVGSQLDGGSTPTVGGERVDQDFEISDLNSPWLPAAYRPLTVSGIKGITYDPQSGSLISDNNTLTGISYHVTSLVSQGESEVTRLEAAPPPVKSAVEHYLQLPPLHTAVTDLARQIVAGKTTEYDKAVALQNYLRDPANFTYSLAYDYRGPNPLDHFLFTAHQGYCQQFAGSFAVLARIVGLPTRLAVGWTWGEEIGPGIYRVTDQLAHTWPEVYFTGVGWVPFEPTPSRGIPGAQNYTGVAPAEAGANPTLPGATATTVPAAASASPGARATTTSTIPPDTTSTAGKHHGNALLRGLLWLGGVLAGIALLFGFVVALRWLHGVATRDRVVNQAAELESDGKHETQDRFARFRKDWAADGLTVAGTFARRLKAILLLGWLLPILPWRARPPALRPEVVTRAELLLTWSELLDLLAWWGVRRLPSETYRELAHRAAIELRIPLSLEPTAVHALIELADAATKAEFGLGSLTEAEAAEAAIELAAVKRALLGSATKPQRLRLAVDPRFSVKSRS
jgi:transglutaminase-like putative cysteine protease